ncbi:MAG: 50S ribosomal protein L23 [Planctomycetes bacterium]|jgi:large subunit ribosomal protein L23|nr:50S ribosomal protein L23 [Planctomycetota bacterium]
MPDLSHHYSVIKRSLFTEKVTAQQERSNTFAFEVEMDANKIQIRQAVQTIFSVRVVDVRTMHVPGKIKRMGGETGRTRVWKKALVTLHEDDRIHEV